LQKQQERERRNPHLPVAQTISGLTRESPARSKIVERPFKTIQITNIGFQAFTETYGN
jgi:hypothetical protein